LSLWDDIEEKQSNILDIKDKEMDILSIEDFMKADNRKLLFQDWVSKGLVSEICKELSLEIKDLSSEAKEEILSTFTRCSKLLNSKNSYLNNPIKSMRLVSSIIDSQQETNKTKLDQLFEQFDDFMSNDFIEFSSKIPIDNEAELYKKLLEIKDEMYESIKFSELINKTHIGIGGRFSAGKSSFLNSILNRNTDDDILPVSTVPTTAIATYIVRKEDESSNDSMNIYTFNKNGKKSLIDKESLLAISHEFYKMYKFGLISIINKIVIDIDSMEYKNIAFLDTPGYSKADGKEAIDQNIAQTHLSNIDSLIWLIDIDNGVIVDEDIKFLQSLKFDGDILIIINKADKKPLKDIQNIIKVTKDSLTKANIKYKDVVAYSSHDKKEYFSKEIIKDFLKSKDRLQVIDFTSRVINILSSYINHIQDMKKHYRNTLKLVNQIDLYGTDIVNQIDDFDEFLRQAKQNVTTYKQYENDYLNIKKDIIDIVESIDNIFNKNLSDEQKKEKNIFSKLNEVGWVEKKHENLSKDEYRKQIQAYTDIINLNIDKELEDEDNTFFKTTKKIAKKISKELYLDLNPKNEIYFYKRANAYKSIGDYKNAITDYNKAIKLSSDVEMYYEERAESYISLKQYKKAIEDYTKLLEFDNLNKNWYLKRAKCYEEREQYKKAIEDYTILIEFTPQVVDYYKFRVNCYIKLENFKEAIKDYTKLIELDEDVVVMYYNRATSFFNLNQFEEVLYDLDKITDQYSDDAQYFYIKAECYHQFSQDEEAYENYQKSIDLNSSNPDSYYKIVKDYFYDIDDSQALSYIEKAIELNPNKEEYYLLKLEHWEEEFMEDVSSINKLIKLDNKNPLYYILRAEFYKQHNDIKAIKDIDKAVKLSSDNEDIEYIKNVRDEIYRYFDKDIEDNQSISFRNVWKNLI